MSNNISWLRTFQPRTTPAVSSVAWPEPSTPLGPVVEFKHVFVGGQVATAQAYPPGTGNRISDMVDFVMEEARGPFRFGIEQTPSGKVLHVQLALSSDRVLLVSRFKSELGGERK